MNTLALYRSKSVGRNCFTIYDEAMSAELEARNMLEGDLRDAIARCQFELHYQPFVDVATGRRSGFEALVRWRHPSRGLIPPDQFIPLAEETGLIVPLGEWVLRRACADAAAWPSEARVAVNLSPVQFKEAELFDTIRSALRDSGLAPERLERSPSPFCWSAVPRTMSSWKGSRASASISRSTISAPAIRR